MIEESLQELAIAYVLGELSVDAIRSFEEEIERNPELAGWVRDHEESLASLAALAPSKMPSATLRATILSQVHSSNAIIEVSKRKIVPFAWYPLALAAGFVLVLVLLGLDDLRVRGERFHLEAFLQDTNRQMADLKRENILANVKIASLAPQSETVAKANALVVWDSERQEGIIKLVDLPKADPGKDYQLWAIDPKYPSPVSAGVLSLGTDGAITISFKPTQPVAPLAKFAISIERAGGADQPAGPIVFVGN